jgi:hypothetical protein
MSDPAAEQKPSVKPLKSYASFKVCVFMIDRNNRRKVEILISYTGA